MEIEDIQPPQLQYDAWLIWLVSNNCNLNCSYCTSNVDRRKACFSRSDIRNILKTLDSTGKIFHITFAGGGEPFTTPDIIEYSSGISKNHYISFISNTTSSKIRVFSERIDPSRVKFFRSSFHIKELEKTGLLERYIENYLILKNKNFPIVAYAVAHPSMIPQVDKYVEYFKERGVHFQFEFFIGNYNGKNYPIEYSDDELNAFSLDTTILKQDVLLRKGSFCNAGYNTGLVTPEGEVFACYNILKSMGNLNKSIKFNDYLIKCPFETCPCPLSILTFDLFTQALKETDRFSTKPLSRIRNIFSKIGY